MLCPTCGAENEAGHKFCSECGTKLASVCPGCGAPVSSSHKFCPECGTALHAATAPAEPASAPAAERRLVSVLFADLVGFTPLSEARDPEEIRDLLTTYFDRSREIIERFGGVVDKFIGDAVMAVWGATAVHEDDAERAVRAGLELVDMVSKMGSEVGISDLALRAGITSGETSVGPGGNEKGLVVGDLVNTASRLQSIAEPGTVLVGETTSRLCGDAIEMEALGERSVKGKEVPVSVWRARRVLGERGGRGRTAGLEPPFVGRDEEFRLLKDMLNATARESRARLVSIIGEAGIGKSRLAWELQKYADGLVEPIYWHQGRSPAYGEGLTFWALADMIRGRAGIAETDDPMRSRTKLRTAVADLVGSAEDRQWIEPRLAALLGLEAMPEGERSELFGALRTFFHHIARRGTTVLIFEDLHWADSGLLEFIDELVDRSQRHPILVVTLARPDLLEREPTWGSGKRNFVSLHLAPLTEEAMEELARGIVPGAPDEAVAAVVGQAGGIPMYAVELARMLIADGVLEPEGEHYRLVGDIDRLGVPESVRAVIGARIDRLADADREVLKDASVLGQSFTVDGLAALREEDEAVLADGLRNLVRQELLEYDADPRSPERSMYRFVQSLIREVAYSRLNREERRARHLAAADFYADLGDVEFAALIASHFMGALEATTAGDTARELRSRAIAALRDAAKRAADLHSHRQALALCEQALEIADEPSVRAELWQQAAMAANGALLEDEAVTYAERALETYEAAGDEEKTIEAAALLGQVLNHVFRSDEAVAVLEPLLPRVQTLETLAQERLVAELARSLMLVGREAESARLADDALAAAERFESVSEVVDLLITRATALGNLGRLREARILLDGAIGLADESGLPLLALRAANNLGVILGIDAPGTVSQVYKDALATARRVGDAHYVLRFSFWAAIDHLENGEFDEALARLDSVPEEDVVGTMGGWFRYLRADIERMCAPSSEATAAVRTAMAGFADTTDPQSASMAKSIQAGLLLTERRLDEAYEMAMTIDPWGAYPQYLQTALIAAIGLRDRDRLRRVLVAIGELGRGGRMLQGLQLLAEGAVASLEGRTGEAEAKLREAIGLWKQVANPMDVVTAQLCTAFLLGVDHPVGREAAGEANAWITEVGAELLRDLWAEVLPGAETAAAGA